MESRNITPAAGHSEEDLRRAALYVARWALEVESSEDAQEKVLTEVLQIMGYRTKTPVTEADFRTDAYGRLDRHHRANVKPREAKRKARRYEKGETEVTTVPVRGYTTRRHGVGPACGDDRGTLRGYNRHISAYNTACPDCLRARQAALDERWEKLGIPSYARDGVRT